MTAYKHFGFWHCMDTLRDKENLEKYLRLKMQDKLISIIMNCHNGEKFLSEAINSILNQSYKNWELIFWDNCSTDNSPLILKQFKDHRIKYFKSDLFTSLGEARQLAFEKCLGEYVAFLDTDDIWYNNKLEKQIEKFERNVGIVTCKYLFFNDKIKKPLYQNKIKEGTCFQKFIRKL